MKHLPLLIVISTILLLILIVLPSLAYASDSWIAESPMPISIGLSGSNVAFVDDKMYIVVSGSIFEYNWDTSTWVNRTRVPTDVYYSSIVTCQNKIYLIGSVIERTFCVNLVYDPAIDTWETKASMPQTVQGYTANVVSNKIYLIGGVFVVGAGRFDAMSTNWVYVPSDDSWHGMAPLLTAVGDYASAVMDGKIYVIGGISDIGYTNLVQIFDPGENKWTYGTPMPSVMARMSAVATMGINAEKRIYVFGGRTLGNEWGKHPTVDWTQVYDPQIGNWSIGAPMPVAKYGLPLANFDDKLYLVGEDGEFSWQEYTPEDYSLSGSPLPTGPNLTPAATPHPTPSTSIPELFPWSILFSVVLMVLVLFLIKRRR